MPTRGGKILHWGSVTTGEWKKKQRSDEGIIFMLTRDYGVEDIVLKDQTSISISLRCF